MSNFKTSIALIPSVLIVHRLIKNFRYFLNSKKSTVGGVARAQMTIDEAVNYANSIFTRIDKSVSTKGSWYGKRVLEVGPGDSLGTGLLCLSKGASSYCAIDRFAVGMDLEFEKQVFKKLFLAMDSEQQANCKGVVDFLEKNGSYPGDQFVYRNNLPIEEAPIVLGIGTFDVIYSNAVLEHVSDLSGTISSFSKLLSSDGVMRHEVDLRSHQTYEKHPLHFLEYPQWLWRLMSSHNGEPNRSRVPQYKRLLIENGVFPVEINVTKHFDVELVSGAQPKLCTLFKNMSVEELQPAVFNFTFHRDKKKS